MKAPAAAYLKKKQQELETVRSRPGRPPVFKSSQIEEKIPQFRQIKSRTGKRGASGDGRAPCNPLTAAPICGHGTTLSGASISNSIDISRSP